jgi:hypothetical protein
MLTRPQGGYSRMSDKSLCALQERCFAVREVGKSSMPGYWAIRYSSICRFKFCFSSRNKVPHCELNSAQRLFDHPVMMVIIIIIVIVIIIIIKLATTLRYLV